MSERNAEASTDTQPSGEDDPPVESTPDLPKLVSLLKWRAEPFGPEKSFYLVGTAHVSKKSCQDVEKVIRTIKPQIVVLELCSERKQLLYDNFKAASTKEMYEAWRAGRTTLLAVVYSYMMSCVADALEVAPGEEFRVALREAQQIGAKIMLGDRLVSITLARTWAALSAWQKIRFVFELLITGISVPSQEIEKLLSSMEEADVLTDAIKEMGATYPSLLETLLRERNLYMVHQLRQCAPWADRVVAVVGAGHLPGMRECWNAEIDVAELNSNPAERRGPPWGRIVLLTSACSAVFLAAWYVRARRR
ncbi:hypothetical protein WJX73_002146 [Symbiochloris irregularis]|uniref:TraB domain-containing protein n=1 Tax=Symbiochloris irregularis TaxID=706552 RepID=A0AAW1P6E8_9CHLO